MDTQAWPEWSETLINSGFPETSLLAGTEPAVWDALGCLTLNDFANGKQVTLRKALEDIGLGWVATNTTPFRIAVGGLFDAAEAMHRKNSQHSDRNITATASTSRSVPAIAVDTLTLPEPDGSIIGPLTKDMATATNSVAIWCQLESHGAFVIRNAVEASVLTSEPKATQAKATKLARTMGNGVAGDPPSVYRAITAKPEWYHSLERILGQLLSGPGSPDDVPIKNDMLNSRSILLLAGEGAENWAHQDNNDDTPPVQAVLMLSNPEEDFAGGEFYVSRQVENTDEAIRIVRYKIPFRSPGDLVLFVAGKDRGWWHGMLPGGA